MTSKLLGGKNSNTSLESRATSFVPKPGLFSQSYDPPWASLGLHRGCPLVQTWENLALCFPFSGSTFLFPSGAAGFSTPQTLLRDHNGPSSWNTKMCEAPAPHTSSLRSGRVSRWEDQRLRSTGRSASCTQGTGGSGGQRACRKKQLRSPTTVIETPRNKRTHACARTHTGLPFTSFHARRRLYPWCFLETSELLDEVRRRGTDTGIFP